MSKGTCPARVCWKGQCGAVCDSTQGGCSAGYACDANCACVSTCSASNCGVCGSSSACGAYNVGTNDCWWDTSTSHCCADGYYWSGSACTYATPCSPVWPTLPGSVSGGSICCYYSDKYGSSGDYLTPIQIL